MATDGTKMASRDGRAERSRRLRRRGVWFDAGADAFGKSLPHLLRETFPDGAPPVYVCPLYAFPLMNPSGLAT